METARSSTPKITAIAIPTLAPVDNDACFALGVVDGPGGDSEEAPELFVSVGLLLDLGLVLPRVWILS